MLLITGSTGDAGEWAHVASTLAQECTVVTHDRRGFSRSPRLDGWTTSSVTEHAQDAAALLRALELVPAVVVGHSAGGSIACSLVVGHPEVVRHAVLNEPPLLAVLPDGQKLVAGIRAAADQAMAEGGPRWAMEGFMRGNVADEVVDQWFEQVEPAERDRVLDNGAVLFSIELPWVARFVPDLDGMRASGVPLTVVLVNRTATSGWGPGRGGWPRAPGPTPSSCPAGTSGSLVTQRSSLPLCAASSAEMVRHAQRRATGTRCRSGATRRRCTMTGGSK